jgi:hypothetical protein
LRNTRYEATRTQKLLRAASGTVVPVCGLIVIVGAKEIKIREQPEDVTVLDATQLTRWLKGQKPHLDPTQLSALRALVRDEATWTRTPGMAADVAGFATLRREVRAAQRVRVLWGVALLVTILSITVPMATSFYTNVLGG